MLDSRHPSLLAQLRVVLLSYITRPGLRWAALAVAIGAALYSSAVLVAKVNGHSWTEGDAVGSILAVFGAYTGLFGIVGFAIVFLLHARQQLIGWAARVFPNTRPANLLVAGVALPVFAILVMLLTQQNYGHPLGLFAVWFGVMILAGYATLRPSLLIVIVIGGWALFHFVPMLDFHINLLTADRQRIDRRDGQLVSNKVVTRRNFESLVLVSGEPIPLGILDKLADEENRSNRFAGAMMRHYYDLLQTRRLAFVLGDIIAFIGLLPLTRPSRGWNPFRNAVSLLAQRWNGEQARRLHGQSRFEGLLALRQHTHITSRFSRSLHRRIATHDWRAAGVAALAMALLSVWFTLQFRVESGVPMLLLMLAFLPGALVAVGWRERWPTFEFESLYPASRAEQITDMATVLMLDVAEFWAASTIATVAVCATIRPGILHDGRFWVALLAGGLMQFLWLGGIFFVGQRRQVASYVAGLAPVVIAIFLPLEALWRVSHPLTLKVVLVIGLLEMLLGISIFAMTWSYLQRSPRQMGASSNGRPMAV